MLRLSYFGHIIRPDSLDKAMILGKVDSSRKEGRNPKYEID